MIRFFFKPNSDAAIKFSQAEGNYAYIDEIKLKNKIPERVFVDSVWAGNFLKPQDISDIDYVFVNKEELEKAKRHLLPECQSYLKNRYFFGQDALRIASEYIFISDI